MNIMEDFTSITITRGPTDSVIHNPTSYPLIRKSTHYAIFKLSKNQCVYIYANSDRAERVQRIIQTTKYLTCFPQIHQFGPNYIVMELFEGNTLKDYLHGCMYIPESITKKLLKLLKKIRKDGFRLSDISASQIFIVNDELKINFPRRAYAKRHLIPTTLLKDLHHLLLKESFLMQVHHLAPRAYQLWSEHIYRSIDLSEFHKELTDSGPKIGSLSSISHRYIGKGRQGTVIRLNENQCIKIYDNMKHAKREIEVLLAHQDLSFMPKVFATNDNYVVMEYLAGPDLNSYLKHQSSLSVDITKQLLTMLSDMEKSGFKKIDAPLRHVIITPNGLKLIDHVFSFSHEQPIPLELFKNLKERNFLHSFFEQVKEINPTTYAKWQKSTYLI